MQEIPLQSVPSQITKVVLGGQNVQLLVYQKPQGLFVDINSDGDEVVTGAIAYDVNPLVCIEYTGFLGNLLFVDAQGNESPEYTGLGDRYKLLYLDADEYDIIRQ